MHLLKGKRLLAPVLAQKTREMGLRHPSRQQTMLLETPADARGSRAADAGEYSDEHPQSVQESVVAIPEGSLLRSPWVACEHRRGSFPTLPETDHSCFATSPSTQQD